MAFEWAEPYPEVHKMCVLFDRTELFAPEKIVYQSLQTYLQNGPQCGLVALAMLMGSPTKETVNEIYEYAKKKGYTYNGEIFSASDMLSLTNKFLKNNNSKLYTGFLDCNEIRDFLLSGGLLLVPYDTDKDNSPGLYSGHKAHWCAISGAVLTSDDFFVVAKHGKARNVGIWKLGDLAKSNTQLFEFSPDRKLQDITYKLPDGGISGPLGLNGQCVLIDGGTSSSTLS